MPQLLCYSTQEHNNYYVQKTKLIQNTFYEKLSVDISKFPILPLIIIKFFYVAT